MTETNDRWLSVNEICKIPPCVSQRGLASCSSYYDNKENPWEAE